MKKIISSIAIALGLAVAAQAGTTVVTDKTVITSEAPYGTGFYLGLQTGVNFARYLGTEDVTNDRVGFIAGTKAGYVFGTGLVRPAVEADLFYSGRKDVDLGAFLTNFLVKFDIGQFQPYIGGGVGAYIVDSLGFEDSGLAYQAVGGADFYLTHKVSLFAEYKWLSFNEYFNAPVRHENIIVMGARIHF